MEWNTKDDPRLNLLDRATDYIINLVKTKKIPLQYDKKQFNEGISHISMVVKQGRFSFLTYQQLLRSNFLEEIQKGTEKIKNSLPLNKVKENEKNNDVIATLQWYLRLLSSFEYRLRLGPVLNLEYAIEIRVFKLVKKEPTQHKGIFYLYLKSKEETRNIITNVSRLQEGQLIAIADLPPKTLYNKLSEGMILYDKNNKSLQAIEIGDYAYHYLSKEVLGEVFTQLNAFLKH